MPLEVGARVSGKSIVICMGYSSGVWLAHCFSLASLFYVFANAFEKSDEAFAPRVFLSEVFANFDGCFFTAVVESLDVQEVLPLGRSACLL